MTRQQAVKKLRGIYGKNAFWSVRDQTTSPERREAAQARSLELKAARLALERQYDVLLAEFHARPDVAALQAQLKTLRYEQNETFQQAHLYKFKIGYVSPVGFAHVEAAGDTWEEAFENLKQRRPQRAG